MKFGDIKVSEALGAILAHSLKLPSGRLKKGMRLDEAHIEALRAYGIETVTAGVPDADDVLEDEAAARLATALCGEGLKAGDATTGRANLHSSRDGLFLVDQDCIDRINMLDERITVATLEPWAVVAPGQLTTTVKIIPYAVPANILQQAAQIAEIGAASLSVTSFTGKSTALVMTRLSEADNKLLTKGKNATGQRLSRFGSTIDHEVTVDHAAEPLTDVLRNLANQAPELILILGATAIVDRGDVVPTAVVEAGGTIEQFGMPVDPGNLLLLGRIGNSTVVGIPGCARSPKLNGFDWVLERLHAGLDITSTDIAKMGVGGLLKEIPSRPQPREAARDIGRETDRNVYAIVLAAGQSRRMGKQNKLLARWQGKALISHVIDALEQTSLAGICVVTGHEAEGIHNELAGRDITLVDNPAFATGLSSSLKVGISALPNDADAALVCLADMPLLNPDILNTLVETWAQSTGNTICVPLFNGRYGNPVLWPRRYFGEIMELAGDAGARSIIGLHSDNVLTVPVASDAVLIDVDTPTALQELDRSRGRPGKEIGMVREIVESDIPALFVVRPQTRENAMSVEELAGIGITPDSMKAAIKGSHRGWLYEEDGEVGGFAMGDSDKAELTVIAILPAYEGKGIGGMLLTKVETWLKSEGCKKIWLTTDINPNLRAYGFYLKHGWEDWKVEHDLRFMTRALGQ